MKDNQEAQTVVIKEKTVRFGELVVEIVQMKNYLSWTQKALEENKQFLADLQNNCATNEAERNEICKTRSEEMIALSETIKLLNDDDALEVFKKTLPSGAGFVQLNADASVRRTALRLIRNALGFRALAMCKFT